MRRVGFHTSIAGGIHLSLKRAYDLGCSTMQIFSHNPRGWMKREMHTDEAEEFRRLSEVFDIKPIFVHSSYLINLASPYKEIIKKSIDLLSYEMRIARLIKADYIVLHPGKAAGQDIKTAVRKASTSLSEAFKKSDGGVAILLENTAGQKGDISSSIQLISEIIEYTEEGCIGGICLDTCHAFAAGYDISGTEGLMRIEHEIKRYLSPLGVRLIHLNDSKKGISSGVDRHEHIGKGGIGIKGFKRFLSFPFFNDIPLILETPKNSDNDDRVNLKKVRQLLKAG